jgi:3-dehydroquinate dehydratase
MEHTNNLAEQVIREHVIMSRIIGTFRSENGSWKLQGKNPFEELESLLRKESGFK